MFSVPSLAFRARYLSADFGEMIATHIALFKYVIFCNVLINLSVICLALNVVLTICM